MLNSSAPEGKDTKYARYEHERRFLLTDPPLEEVVRTVEIEDRYLSGTRVRLRRAVTVSDDAATSTVYKLTQKIPRADGSPGLITTFYLDVSEYETFSRLPGHCLDKTRVSVPPLGIDCFSGPLAGLYLAEAEFDTQADMDAFVPPGFVVADVTSDVRFTGGQLAVTGRSDLRETLAEYRIILAD